MNLKQVVVNNGGMSQDLSVSKQDNKLAFENKNIRIQATDDGTLLSVTNLKTPKTLKVYLGRMPVVLIGSCATPDYLVLFTKTALTPYAQVPENPENDDNWKQQWQDCIYRIDLDSIESDSPKVNSLYYGNLNFSVSSYIDTLYYEEGEKIKKVYWTNGKNSPRVINLITPSERNGGEFSRYTKDEFEFYPSIFLDELGEYAFPLPQINVTKNRNVASQLPAGIVQYFVSYYWKNGSETLIVNSTDTYTIDYSNRGAKADETGMCAFDIEIPASSVNGTSGNPKFDYIRIYSAIRTSYNGPLIVKIVGDIKLEDGFEGSYKITDTGINQEQLDEGHLFFIGGTPFIAKTLTEKDNTLFLGGIEEKQKTISETLKNNIRTSLFNGEYFNNGSLTLELSKQIPNVKRIFGSKYPYSLQLDGGSKQYKTFKSGETYRFGMQFQTSQGQWSDVVWIGDRECTDRPSYDSENNCFLVNDGKFSWEGLDNLASEIEAEGFVNYRILMADPELSNGRKIKAQGILCPTMFTPGQRAMNSPYSLPSWVMRPKNGTLAYHHFEPIFSSVVDGGEIASFTPNTPSKSGENNKDYPVPYLIEENDGHTEQCYLVTYISVSTGNKLVVRTVKVWSDDVETNFYDSNGNEPGIDKYEVLCDYCVNYSGGSDKFWNALNAIPSKGSSNPRGYKGSKDSNKYIYIFKVGNQATPDTGGVVSLMDVLNDDSIGNPSLAPEPSFLAGEEKKLSASSFGLAYEFNNLIHNDAKDSNHPYYIGEHLSSYNTPLVKKGFVPLYDVHYLTKTQGTQLKRTNSNVDHPLNGWTPLDGNIVATENRIFSRTQYVYSSTTTKNIGSTNKNTNFYYTLPEIFRPRCTVWSKNPTAILYPEGFDTATGSDGDYYVFDETNTRGEEEFVVDYPGLGGDWNYAEGFIQIIPIVDTEKEKAITDSYNDYYVDESIVTLDSPDIDAVAKDNNLINLNIVGIAPLNNSVCNFDASVKSFASSTYGGINTNIITGHNDKEFSPLYTDFLYKDFGWAFDSIETNDKLNTIQALYKTYLFGANNFIGVTNNDQLEDLSDVVTIPGDIEKQQFFNQYFSDQIFYLPTVDTYNSVLYSKINEEDTSVTLQTNQGNRIYRPVYDNLIVSQYTSHIFKQTNSNEEKNKLSFGNTRVKFSTTPHIVLNLVSRKDGEIIPDKYLLPHFVEDTDYFSTIRDGKLSVWSTEAALGDDSDNPINPNREIPEIGRGEWGVNTMTEVLSSAKNIRSVWEEIPSEREEYSSNDYFEFITDNSTDPNYDPIQSHHTNEYLVTNALDALLFPEGSRTEKVREVFSNYVEDEEYDESTPPVLIYNYRLKDMSAKFIFGLYKIGFIPPIPYAIDPKCLYTLTTEKVFVSKILIDSLNNHVVNVELSTYESKASSEDRDVTDFDDIYSYQNGADTKSFLFVWYLKKIIASVSSTYEEPYTPPLYTINPEDYVDYNITNVEYPVKYISKPIVKPGDFEADSPYLFIGEVYQDISQDNLYGGNSPEALRKLTWIPISATLPLKQDVTTMEGDTYYQRWDCLKTYPTTEEDINQVVDITSFMVETHKNLDARCDVNRATYSLMSRPSNFNLFNPVYNQSNNIFSYTTEWTDLTSGYTPNRITWSLTKNLFGDIDTWTNVSLENSTKTKYPVTKLINWNNQVLALTEHSMEIVNFNAKNLIPSSDNSFIELQNSNKVDGTVKLQAPYGTHNMSTVITEKGLYFIDDNEKSLLRFGGEGPSKIGMTKLIDWFHNNIIQGTPTFTNESPFHLEYDNIHKDLYIKNKEFCLVYNESLEEFTSFVTYSGNYWLFNYNGDFYAYRQGYDSNNCPVIGTYRMFGGDSYNTDFGRYWRNPDTSEDVFINGSVLEYSVAYAINPNSFTDKVFTNGILAADLDVTGTNVPNVLPNSTKYTAENEADFPFNTVRAWTEYQNTGDVAFEKIIDKPSNLKQKFRFWKFIIPRDATTNVWPKNRIRNPWMRIKLLGNSTKKMEFHNMTIQYME